MHNTLLPDNQRYCWSLSILPKHPMTKDMISPIAESVLDSLRINSAISSPCITLVKDGLHPLIKYRFTSRDFIPLEKFSSITSHFRNADVLLRYTQKTPDGTSRSSYAWSNSQEV